MMDGRAGHGQGLARGGIFGEFLDGVRRPSGRWRYGTIVVGRANHPCLPAPSGLPQATTHVKN